MSKIEIRDASQGTNGSFNRTRKTKKNRRKAIIIVLVCLFILILGVGAFSYYYAMSKLDKVKRVEEEAELTNKELSCVDVNGYANILLIGVDARDMSSFDDARFDCIIIASIEEKTGKVHLPSVYRDTLLKIGDDDMYEKINAALAYGGSKEGPKLLMKSLNQAFDLNISKYVMFNFKSVADMVDALDGVDVNVEEYEIEELNKFTVKSAVYTGRTEDQYNLVEKPGLQTLTGPQAVSYGRIRKGVGDDFKRTERMRIIAGLLLDKIKKQSVKKIDKLLDIVMPEIRTNLSNSDILALAFNAIKYNIKGSDSMPYNVTTGYLSGVSYVFPANLRDDVIEMHKKVFNDVSYYPSETVESISEQIIYLSTGSSQYTDIPEEVIETPIVPETPAPQETPSDPEPNVTPGTGDTPSQSENPPTPPDSGNGNGTNNGGSGSNEGDNNPPAPDPGPDPNNGGGAPNPDTPPGDSPIVKP